ncbi:protein decapping 5 [Lycium barbarum]|uniref:protein decapping 5 n=1 Tax=Lycium barbarum TaxID=112863 RepID=UPI00293EA136|nr:protein decapping 5 [Lycium barbarum]
MAAESSSAGRSSGGGGSTTADSYIGSLISLTSKSEIRYEGILYNINTDESSIGLRNVRSFGTEGRKKDGPQVPPSDKIYEYILFRGSDIKDLQVKSSPPLQPTPAINNDPAIIQSHYPRPPSTSASLPAAVGGSLTDLSSHSAQPGHPGSTFQSGLPLYQPGGNIGSWGPSPPPPNAGAGGLGMPMYWQGFYGAPNGLPQMQQQALLRPPPGLAMPPSMQQPPSMPQMQFSGFNSSLPTGGSSLQASNLPEYPSSLMPTTTSLTSSSLPTATLPSSVSPLQPVVPATETISSLSKKASVSAIPASTLSASLPTLPPLTTSPDVNPVVPPVSIKPNPVPIPTLSQSVSTVVGPSSSHLVESPTPSLVTPGQLLQSGPIDVPSTQSTQTAQKDVEVVQVLSAPSSEPPAPVKAEAQPPILPLPPQTRQQKTNGAPYQPRYNNYRGRGGRGMGVSRPVTKFDEDFDFMAMNEKFKKDEVWGHLGKSNREGDGNGSDEDISYIDYEDDLPKIDVKPVYNKDDFFDSLSSNALDHDSNHGRTRFSEQRKIDVETFGDFSRYRGGRGGRGPGRGGRSRGGYGNYGRGGYGSGNGNGYGYGYGYGGRGRGRGVPYRA